MLAVIQEGQTLGKKNRGNTDRVIYFRDTKPLLIFKFIILDTDSISAGFLFVYFFAPLYFASATDLKPFWILDSGGSVIFFSILM